MAGWTVPPLPMRWDKAAMSAMVGRRHELDVIDGAWRATIDGARQVVFIGGEPGVGKSRLAAETAISVHEQGFAVVVGTCVSNLGATYQPFVQSMDALATAIEAGELPAAGGAGGPVDQVALLRTLVGGASGDHPTSEPREPRFARQLFQACVDAVTAAAGVGPLLLILEDLHWAGDTALQLLSFLVQGTAEARVLILATQRTSLPDRSPDLVSTVGDLYRLDGVRRIDLAGLAAEDITEFVVNETRATSRSAHDAAGILRDQTGGNPFVLKELLRDLGPKGGLSALRSVDLQSPESVRETMRHRLVGLAPEHRRAVELAAVVGEEFSIALLSAAIRDSTDDAQASAALTFAALEAAAGIGVVELGRDPVGMSRFPHALARQAVLDLMTEYQRASYNARVAMVLEQQFPAADLRVQRLAHHYANAHVLGHVTKAVEYLAMAAEAAQAALAHDDAARLFERAAGLADEPLRRDELRLDAARSLVRAGKFRRARDLNQLVASTSGPSLRLQASVGFEAASWRSGEPGELSVRLLTSALDGVAVDPKSPLYIRAIAALGRAHAFTGNVPEAQACDSRALELARALGDDRVLAAALQIGLQTAMTPLNLASKLERAVELTTLCQAIGDLRHLGPAAFHRAAASYVHGDRLEMTAAHADLARATRATGQPFWEWVESCVMFGLHFMRADFDDATRSVSVAQELGRSFDGDSDTDGPSGLQGFMVRRETGRLDAIRPFVTGEEDLNARWAPGLLALYCELELREPAARALDHVLTRDLPRQQSSSTWPAVLAFLCEATVWLADGSAAERMLPMAAEYAGLNLMGGEFLALFGSADRQLAGLASVLGQPEAEQHFERALEMDGRMGSPVHVATTLAAHVTHLHRTKERSTRLGEVSNQARTLVSRYGLARVRRHLDRAEERGLAPAKLPAGLTSREAEVLGLLGIGYSNRQISEQLVISENTAANHVRSILMKTGAANRTQAAIYAAAHGLLSGLEPDVLTAQPETG